MKQKFPAVEMRVKVGQERKSRQGEKVNELRKLEEELREIEQKIGLLG